MKFRRITASAAAIVVTLFSAGEVLPETLTVLEAGAAFDLSQPEKWEYEEVEDGIKLLRYSDTEEYCDIYVPDKIEGKKVTEISAHVFDSWDYSSFVTFPDDTVRFDGNIFKNSKIYVANFPDYTVFPFGDDRNYVSISYPILCNPQQDYPYMDQDESDRYHEKYCELVNGRYYAKKVDITVPSSVGGADVVAIDQYAFSYSPHLNRVTLPDTIRIISIGAFSGSSVTAVDIPESVHFIPDYCFSYCTGLEEINLPDSIIAVSDEAFYDTKFNTYDPFSPEHEVSGDGCSMSVIDGDWRIFYYYGDDLNIYAVPEEYFGTQKILEYPEEINGFPVKRGKVINGIDEPENYRLLSKNPHVEELRLPDDLNYIPNLERSSIKKLNIPSGCTEISDYTFMGCANLTSLTIPPNIKRIGRSAFSSCEHLTDINIESDSIEIDWEAFMGTGLTSLDLPGTCTIQNDIIHEGLEKLSFRAGSKVELLSRAFCEAKDLKELTFSPDIKDIYIGDSAFAYTALEEVELGSNVANISRFAFSKCDKLKRFSLDGGTSGIGGSAFKDDKALTDVVINGKHNINNWAFCGCTGLEDITLDTTSTVYPDAFDGCTNLYRINGIEAIGRNDHTFAPELDSFIRKNFDGATTAGFVDRFIRNSVKAAVAETVTEDMSDIEKAKALHDWICDNCRYADNQYAELGNHTESSVFMDGVAVCDGYARTYNMLLHEAGLKCWFVSNRDHSWNVAEIDGNTYHIDTTWDDSAGSHEWFMRSDAELKAAGGDHKEWEPKIQSEYHDFQDADLPECTEVMGDLDRDGDFDDADITLLRERILSGKMYDIRADLDFNGKANAGDLAAAVVRLASPGLIMGDVDSDGFVTSADASRLLDEYSLMSVSSSQTFTEKQTLTADVNVDGHINAADATAILAYYTYLSTGGKENISAYTENPV